MKWEILRWLVMERSGGLNEKGKDFWYNAPILSGYEVLWVEVFVTKKEDI